MSSALNWLVDGGDGAVHAVTLTLIRASLVLALAWVGHFAWKNANPQLRVLLWRATAVGLIVAALLGQSALNWDLRMFPAASTAGSATRVEGARADKVVTRPSPVVDQGAPHAATDVGVPSDSSAAESAAARAILRDPEYHSRASGHRGPADGRALHVRRLGPVGI